MAASVLIVDDSFLMRRMLRRSLEDDGWAICGEAADGLEALEKIERLTPDLVILDFSMPRMNGLETAKAIKSLLPTITMIMFTAHKAAIPGESIHSAGIRAICAKEDGPTPLLEEIRKVFDSAIVRQTPSLS